MDQGFCGAKITISLISFGATLLPMVLLFAKRIGPAVPAKHSGGDIVAEKRPWRALAIAS